MFNYDLKLLSSFPDLTDTSGVTNPIIAGANSTNLVDVLTSSARDRFIDLESDPAAGIVQGFYGDKHINALLTAMQNESYGRVLAQPKILVNDGSTGTIDRTDITNVRIDQVIIPEEGTQRTATDFREYTSGISLLITPNISEGDLLRLEVEITRSDFTQTFVDRPPNQTENNVKTIVTVPDGKTIILGGLVRLNQSKGSAKVPLLGDLPLLGGLFRSIDDSVDDTKLYVFLKANILRPDETVQGLPELERISSEHREAFEKDEQRFQEMQSWPGIDPEPIDPNKVLDVR
jgi:general secretion pathway protein D